MSTIKQLIVKERCLRTKADALFAKAAACFYDKPMQSFRLKAQAIEVRSEVNRLQFQILEARLPRAAS